MGLLVDKFQTKDLLSLEFHEEVNQQLLHMAQNNRDIPHMLIYGPRGSGKMTRIRSILQILFDQAASKLKIDQKTFVTASGKRVEVSIFSSNHHIEINPSDAGIYDRIIIQEVIKELAQSQQVDKSKAPYKVVVILEAEKLSKDAQHALRRTMEKYSSNLRLILCASGVGKILGPIKSRCTLIRIPSLSLENLTKHLQLICRQENYSLSDDILCQIALNSEGNIRQAMLMLEASSKNSNYQIDWKNHLTKICVQIHSEQSPASLLQVRSQLYDLLGHCIPPAIIFKACNQNIMSRLMIQNLLRNLLRFSEDLEFADRLTNACSCYEQRLSRGSKPIFHLEAFVAKTMSLIADFKLTMDKSK